MPKYLKGDRVRYTAPEYFKKEALIDGVKVFTSEVTGRPIYYIIWNEDEERFKYGIHEKNLELVKRKDPDWRL